VAAVLPLCGGLLVLMEGNQGAISGEAWAPVAWSCRCAGRLIRRM